MKLYRYLFIFFATVGFSGCSDFLDVKPVDKITEENVFGSVEGVTAYLADLYYNAPIEDFNYAPYDGFNFNGVDANNAGFFHQVCDDDGIGSEHEGIAGGGAFEWWEDKGNRNRGFDRGAWKVNRDVNLFLDKIAKANLDEATKKAFIGEGYFLRAYIYFGLAKRYGGVPIITKLADVNNVESLFVPRSTEKETWDFVINTCDTAAKYLENYSGNKRRASKWAALALKSRVALFAASVAKYWDQAPLSGPAVEAGLAKLDKTEADRYYKSCIEASKQIMESGSFSLYKPSPANPQEAEKNYSEMFEEPNVAEGTELIFLKGFTMPGIGTGTNIDAWANPVQTAGPWPHPGRFNPSLELADTYESYSKPGLSSPIVTTSDGKTGNDFDNGYDASRTYIQYADPLEIFADKDARLKATAIIPFSSFKNTEIVIQGGYIKPDGTAVIEQAPQSTLVDGVEYYVYGSPSHISHSGFQDYQGNMTRTGFSFKKFLRTDYTPKGSGWNNGVNDWIDMRYAEVLLNYAEAVVESNTSAEFAGALQALNATRKRAAHTSDIPLTLQNVLRERRVELAFESFRYWDLIRRREMHKAFNNTKRHALVPVLDLRTKKYIFVRQKVSRTNPHTFITQWYYKCIPNVGASRLIQNPQY